MPMELVRSQPPDDAQHTGQREKQCAYITRKEDDVMNEELGLEKLNDLAIHYPVYLIDAAAEHFNGDECKLEAIAVVLSGLDALCMPSSALLFVQVLPE